MKALIPFKDGQPWQPHAAYWDGCEIVKDEDSQIIVGPHGSDEYPLEVEFREYDIPAHWPQPIEPAQWEDPVTPAVKKKWKDDARAAKEQRKKIAEMEKAKKDTPA